MNRESNLPPGVTDKMIEDAQGHEIKCSDCDGDGWNYGRGEKSSLVIKIECAKCGGSGVVEEEEDFRPDHSWERDV